MKRNTLLLILAVLLAVPLVSSAQGDDGRVNLHYWMDGFGVYCTDAAKNPADTWENGGLQLLNPQGEEVLYVPAAAVKAGIAEAQATGTFSTLAVAAEDAWFFPPIAIYYHPDEAQFQVNIAKSSPEDLAEGKLYEFRWTVGCEGITKISTAITD